MYLQFGTFLIDRYSTSFTIIKTSTNGISQSTQLFKYLSLQKKIIIVLIVSDSENDGFVNSIIEVTGCDA